MARTSNGSSPAAAPATVAEALRPGGIHAVYQPLVHLETGQVLGYKALGRGPAGTSLASPVELLAAARPAGLLTEVDWACRAATFRGALDAEVGNSSTSRVRARPSHCPRASADAAQRSPAGAHP